MAALVAVFICFVGYLTPLQAEECQVPKDYRDTLIHHLAWTHVWWEVRYLDEPVIHFYLATTDTQVVWHEAISHMTFQQYTTGPESDLRGATCKQTPLQCIQSQLRVPLREEDILECTVPTSLVDRWRPSRDSQEKRNLLEKIGMEVRKQAGYAGTMKAAFCNDFNINDPGVYAVADVVQADGGRGRIVISMVLSSRNGGSVSTWRLDDEDDARQIVRKIFINGPLKIDADEHSP